MHDEAAQTARRHRAAAPGLPVVNLLALATASFVSVMTEALPAGLLPEMSRDLGVSEAASGQLVTIYALASLMLAVPVASATQGMRRKPLLLTAILGFAAGNFVTFATNDYALALAARFCAGAGAGMLWALLPGYASRLAPVNLRGRAIAIAMSGVSVAMSIGVPLGTAAGKAIGWHGIFGILGALAVCHAVWVAIVLPDFPGLATHKRFSPWRAVAIPGVGPLLAITFTFVMAHNILYTYIAPFVALAGLGDRVGLVLLVFGIAGLGGIWIAGLLVDRWLRPLTRLSGLLFAGAALGLGLAAHNSVVVIAGVAVWGLAFGGCGTLFQAALAHVAGEAADVAQSFLVVAWNCAISGGAIVGGALLDHFGAGALPWALLPLLAVALLMGQAMRLAG